MGRVKLEIKKIENPTNRQVTYSKRRNGLIKKAFELSVLCDVDIAVIMFSPSGKLTSFSKDDRIEEVLNRFAETPHHERTKRRFENVQYINKIVQKLADERGVETPGLAFGDHQHEVQELRSSLNKAIAEKEFYAQKSRLFKGDAYLQGIDSVPSLLTIQRELEQALVKVHDRKAQLEDESQYRQGGLSNYQRFQAVQDKPQERKFQIEDDAQLTAFGQNRIQQSSSFGQQLVTVPARDGTASALTEGRNASTSADGAQGSQTHAWHHRVEEQFDNSPAVLSSPQMRDSAGFTSEATSAYYHRSSIPPVFRGNQLEGRTGQGASNAEYSFGAKIEAGAPFGYETAGHAQIMPMSGHGKQVQLTGDVEFPFYSGMQQQHQSHGAWQGQIDLSSSSSAAQASSSSYRGPLIPPGGSRPGTQDQNLGNFNDENYEASGYYNKGY